MNYITNEDGDIKVRYTKTGTEKFLPKRIAEDKHIAKGQEFEIVPAPEKFEFSIPTEHEALVSNPELTIPEIVPAPENEIEEEKTADVAPAKRGRKPNTK